MTVANIGAASQAAAAQQRSDHSSEPRVRVGQFVDLRIVRPLAERQYLVWLGGEQHVVETAMALTAGRTIRTTVVAIGEKLELKYVGTSSADDAQGAAAETAVAERTGDSITDLQDQLPADLNDAQRTAIGDALRAAAEPQLLASGGLFLGRLSLPFDAEALNALYVAQRWAPTRAEDATVAHAVNTGAGGAGRIPSLAALLQQALEQPTDAGSWQPAVDGGGERAGAAAPLVAHEGAHADQQHGERNQDLARQLLNEQDGGSIAYRYGTLPLLIAGQLVELDLVYFHERTRSERSANLRRLVMTFKTERLGRVQVVAQALAEHLSIEIASDSRQANAALAAHEEEIKDLLTQLGWNVDGVEYELDPDPRRAASHVIAHVLNSDRLDRLV
jgi:Flagellar hook-length control protein FliK